MKKLSHPLLSILFIYFILYLSISANAQNAPERETKVLGDINPYEVILYHDYDYDNVIKSWKLKPGMRMLKIPQLDDVPFSILLGSKVSVILFPNYDYNSKGPTKKFLIPYFRLKSSKPRIDDPFHTGPTGQPIGKPSLSLSDKPLKNLLHHYRGSLIIHRKDIGDILGVHLRYGNYFGQFYPLPEKAKDSAIIYHKIPHSGLFSLYSGPFSLSIISGGDGWIASYPPTSHPNLYDIQITITSDNGAKRKLPGPNSKLAKFDLKKLGVQQISSLKMQYKGPLNEQAYLDLPPKKHRAPPAAKPQGVTPAPTPNVSGQWKSNIGVVYDMTQNGDNFEWTVKAKNETGKGFIKGGNVSASWKSPFGSGASNGKITTVDSSGKATKIQWYNGVRFYR